MQVSSLGEFTLWLHKTAVVTTQTQTASELLAALGGAQYPAGEALTEAQIAGLELRSGRPRSQLARTVQRAAIRRLRELPLVLRAVDELGYSTTLVRSLLQTHYMKLQEAPLDSFEYAVYLDLKQAVQRASGRTQEIAKLLIEGYGPLDISDTLKTNGSRRISKATAELSRILEGRA
jgi:hypothetical protein